MKKPSVFSNVTFKRIYLFSLGAMALLFANIAASGIYDSFNCISDFIFSGKVSQLSYLRIAYIAVFIMLAWFVYAKLPRFRPQTRRLSNENPAEYRNHLILFLSKLPDSDCNQEGCIPDWLFPKMVYKLDEDIQAMSTRKWQWEMPLRAINHQRKGDLRSITVVCSNNLKETDGSVREGSITQAHHFINLLKKYDELGSTTISLLVKNKGGKFFLISSPISMEEVQEYDGLGFEKFDEITSGLWWLVEEQHYPDSQVMIDITSGQKPTSVAGAALTFNRNIKAQYVQTEPPKDVISYDVELVSLDNFKI